MPKGVGWLMKSVCLQFPGRPELSDPSPTVERFAKCVVEGKLDCREHIYLLYKRFLTS